MRLTFVILIRQIIELRMILVPEYDNLKIFQIFTTREKILVNPGLLDGPFSLGPLIVVQLILEIYLLLVSVMYFLSDSFMTLIFVSTQRVIIEKELSLEYPWERAYGTRFPKKPDFDKMVKMTLICPHLKACHKSHIRSKELRIQMDVKYPLPFNLIIWKNPCYCSFGRQLHLNLGRTEQQVL